jgi:hypothetical protein
MTTVPKTMPSRHDRAAPKFDGKPSSLAAFIDDISQLAAACALSDQDKIKWTVRYAPSEDAELWEMQTNYETGNWEEFKKEIHALYPGSTGDRKYSVANLEALTEKQATIPMETSEEFGRYYRAFSKVATFLKKKDKLTDREISAQFILGLSYSFRVKVRAQLKAQNPTHHTDDPYTLKEISTAALFLLSCNQNDKIEPEPESTPTVKRETFDASNFGFNQSNISMAALAQELTKHMDLLKTLSVAAPVQQSQSYRARDNNCCNFCSDPTHYINNCPHANEYINKGKCKRNAEGFMVLPNGEQINARIAPGKNLRERIDNWHSTNNTNVNIVSTVSTNFVEASHLQDNIDYSWIEPKLEDDESLPTEREVEELQMLESLIATTQKKVEETKKKITRSGPTTRSFTRQEEQVPKQPVPTTRTNEKPASAGPAPQFRYHTPIEDSALIAKVAKQALDVQITLPIRDILSISPDVRQHIKDQIVTKRVTSASANALSANANNVECFMAALPERTDNIIVADHSVNLRVLDLTLDDKVQVEAILDEGSQIVGLRKDIWEKLGVPVRSDHKMNMISANASSNQTIGLIHDLKVTIGAYNFYLQVQVVENASYEMLLGRPFLTLTEANTQHYANGDSHITLQDPNSKAIITLPTRARGNAQERQSAHVGSLEIDASYNKRNERSNSSYHNRWFCVQRDDGKLELVLDKENVQSASVGF